MKARSGLALLAAGLAAALTAAYFTSCPVPILRIDGVTSGVAVLETRAAPGDNLWIVFLNSVEGLPVADHFVVGEDFGLTFSETIFQAPYAGYDLPEAGGRVETVAPGTTRISGYERRMGEVTFFAGYRSRHLLLLNGRWIPLYEKIGGGELVRIRVEERSRWPRLWKGT